MNMRSVAEYPTISRQSMRRSRIGFSLVEILAVIAVISIFACILIPAIKVIRDRANTAKSISIGKTLAEITQLYAIEHGGIINVPGPINNADGTVSTQWEHRIAPYFGVAGYSEVQKFVVPSLIFPDSPEFLAERAAYTGWAYNYELKPSSDRPSKVKTMMNIPDSAHTLLATEGCYFFLRGADNSGQDTSFTIPNENSWSWAKPGYRIFFPHNHQSVCIFVDGHIELLEAPINLDFFDVE